MKKFLNIFCITAAAILLCLHTDLYVSAKITDEDIIEKGVYIGDIDVSGLTMSEAAQKVTEYMETAGSRSMTLNAMNDNAVVVSMNDLGIAWNNPDVVEEACSIAKAGNLVARYKEKKDLEHENIVLPLEYTLDKKAVEDVISQECLQYNVEAEDASLKREDGAFVVIPGQTGVVIDELASVDSIVDYVENDWDGEDAFLDLVVTTDQPRHSDEELSKVQDLLGSFTTDYSTSGANRSGNVANGCSLINGSLIYPGETFSVYEAVSPFTAANGYYMAGSYLNGMVVDSLGGGICQVSTTLYNAVLRAELTVKDRHNHSMIVSYVDPSADAAISGTVKDLKFENNTDYPVYIEGYTKNKKITFNIYGVEERPKNRKVTFESEVLSKTVPPGEKVVADPGHGVGYISVQSAHIGYKARLWKIVTVDGKEESREIVNESSYAAVPRTAAVGTATADPNLAAAIQAAIASQSIDACRAVIATGAAPAPNADAIAAQQAQQAAQQAAEAAAAIAAQQQAQAAADAAAQQQVAQTDAAPQ